MFEYFYIPVILILYVRTWRYNYLIDDPVGRDEYLYSLSVKVLYPWYNRRRTVLATATNIGVFISSCAYVHLLFGWKAALLFSVFPLNVVGVAWITGNYYMSTVLLVLAAWYWLIHGVPLAAMAFYGAALNSTLLSIPFIVPALFFPQGWLCSIPLLAFLSGKRLRTGLGLRKKNHDEMGLVSGFAWKNFYHVPRVLAYYIYLSVWPVRLGFFHSFGKKSEQQTWKFWWLSVAVVLSFALMAALIDWKIALCWFAFMGLFSQFIILGQFVTERYMLIANVFFCALLVAVLPYELFLVLAALYFCKTLSYIPAWKDNERLFGYSAAQFPDCAENWVNFASYYIERGDRFTAIKPLLLAERLTVGNKYGIYVDLANCYASGGFFEKALLWTDKALECATIDKVPEMVEQKDRLKSKIMLMEHGQKRLKKMGVI